jgi:hypothetical protein
MTWERGDDLEFIRRSFRSSWMCIPVNYGDAVGTPTGYLPVHRLNATRLKFCEYASHLQTFRSFVFYKSSAICSQRHRLCMHLAPSERIYSQHQRQRSAMGCHLTPGIRVWKGCIRCSQPEILRCVLCCRCKKSDRQQRLEVEPTHGLRMSVRLLFQ